MSRLLTYGVMQQKMQIGYIFIYSIRKIRGTYSGYCMKVRRSSDDALQDIGFSGSDIDESALTTFVGAGSGYVHTWYDQSGNSNNATQTTNANQPRIVSSGTLETENSKPIINFGTQSDPWFLQLPSGVLYNISRLTFSIVAKNIVNKFNYRYFWTNRWNK